MAAIGEPVEHRAVITIEAPLEKVWNVHVDVGHWPQWQPDISRVEMAEPLEVGTSFDWKSGAASVRSTVTTIDPPAVLAWTGTSFGITANHQWRLSSDGTTTRVETHETMDGWPVRLLRGYFQRTLERSLDTWLEALKRRVESG